MIDLPFTALVVDGKAGARPRHPTREMLAPAPGPLLDFWTFGQLVIATSMDRLACVAITASGKGAVVIEWRRG